MILSLIDNRLIRLSILVLITLLAAYLRIGAINHTFVDTPVRADAKDYYSYAFNMRHVGVYSRSPVTWLGPGKGTPAPDALRSPGYPLFLALFVDGPPSNRIVLHITLVQAVLSIATVLLALGVYRRFMTEGWSLLGAFLTAISPHLVSVNTYVLTEALFTFLCVAMVWLALRLSRQARLHTTFLLGVVIAAGALTRPTMLYFIAPLLVFFVIYFGWRRGGPLVLAMFVGFVLVLSPWFVRNLHTLGTQSDSTLMINTLHHGMYPNFEYNNMKASHGIPYRFDPRSKEIARSVPSVLHEIMRRFVDEPNRHLSWYFLGKPVVFLSWDIVAGMGDIFIYPVMASPYFNRPLFTTTHAIMRILHWPLAVLCLVACMLVWIPRFSAKNKPEAVFGGRLIALLILYFLVLHVVGAPFPRYSIPLRPFMYGMGLYAIVLLWAGCKPAFGKQGQHD